MSEGGQASSAILTLPNLLSFLRILLIPVFVTLIVHDPTTTVGLILFAVVVSTDWVDGALARRTDRVTDLGKILDPTADRLAIAAGLVALVIVGAFPLWAALVILVRDACVLVAGAALLSARRVRLEVRYVGKVATFTLVMAIAAIAWGNLGLPLAAASLACGWVFYAVGIVEYGAATWAYAGDIRRALPGAV